MITTLPPTPSLFYSEGYKVKFGFKAEIRNTGEREKEGKEKSLYARYEGQSRTRTYRGRSTTYDH